MSDWRTARAPYATRSRLPEDDLPEIDWGAASFAPGGGDEPEPEPMPDPGEEERAMARLRARIAERDAAEGLMDPWAQAQAAPMGPQSPPLPGSPAPLRAPRGGRTMTGSGLSVGAAEMMPPAAPAAPPMTPQQMAQAAFRQPALDAVRAGVGAVTPPVDPMAPPPTPTAPDAVPQATTNPGAPTVTAGSQAAGLAQRPAAPQSPTTDPTGAPQFAMGATGLGGAQSGMSERVQAGVGGGVFDRQVGAARGEDARRDRLRRILTGIGAMLALRSGNAGFMVPAAIAGGLVRRPDEEATLRANDERAQAVGGAQAEQRALLEQLAMRREAQQAQERQGQQTLALRAQELAGADADRGIRTGLQVTESEREGAMLDPGSDVSARNRMQFREWLRTSPREIQQAVDPRTLDALSATEILTLQDELSSNYNSRQIGGGRGGASSGVPGGIAGVENAPAAFVAAMAQANGEDPSNPSPTTRAASNAQWRRMPRRQQADWVASPDAQRLAQVIGRSLPGYEQAAGGAIAAEQYQTARDIQSNLAAIQGEFDAAIGAAEEIQAADLGSEVRHRFGDFVGVDTPAVAQFNAARASIIATMNRLREAGVMNESEYTRGITELRALSDPRNFISDSTLRLRSIRDGVVRQAEARMSALGYRRTEGGGAAPTTTADAPPAPEREHPITFRVRLPDGRVQQIRTTPSQAERDQARARERGWTVVQ